MITKLFPEDMPLELKEALANDQLMFGNAYYEKITDKEGKISYERVDPLRPIIVLPKAVAKILPGA